MTTDSLMKRMALVGAMGLLALGSAHAQEPQPPIWQEQFDEWEKMLPSGWRQVNESITWNVAEEGYRGRSLALTAYQVEEQRFDLQREVLLDSGQQYTLSAWVYVPEGSEWSIHLGTEDHSTVEPMNVDSFYAPIDLTDSTAQPPNEEGPSGYLENPEDLVDMKTVQPDPAKVTNGPLGDSGARSFAAPSRKEVVDTSAGEFAFIASSRGVEQGRWLEVKGNFMARRWGKVKVGIKLINSSKAPQKGTVLVDDLTLAKANSYCDPLNTSLGFAINDDNKDLNITSCTDIPNALSLATVHTSTIFGKGKYRWHIYHNGVLIHQEETEISCASPGPCPFPMFDENLPVQSGTYQVRLVTWKKILFWWDKQDDICSQELTVTLPNQASASLSINNQFSNEVSVCEFDDITLDVSGSSCETGWFLSLQEANSSWGGIGPGYTQWFAGQAPANIDLRFYAAALWNLGLEPGKQYRLKYAVKEPWDVVTKLLKVRNCGFENTWSNINNSNTDLSPLDGKLYVGDFNGDGDDELIQVIGNQINMLEYRNSNWVTLWSNGGSANAGNGIFPYRNNFVVGDFDKDGKDELLGIASWMTMFHFDNGNWQWGWSDQGNPNASGGLYPYRNNLIVGDFTGDGRDEVLGVTSWMSKFRFENNQWILEWSDQGVPTASGGLYPYRSNLRVGDFDGDGKDELLGLASWATRFRWSGSNWVWSGSTSGNPTLAGWGLPISSVDQVITGNIDYVDGKDELIFFDRGPGAAWMQTADLGGNNQFIRRYDNNGSGFFYSIPLHHSACASSYFTVKPIANQPHHIMLRLRCLAGLGNFQNYYVMHRVAQQGANYRPSLSDEELTQNELAAFVIYPNPAQDQVLVSGLGDVSEEWVIRLVDLQGKEALRVTGNPQESVKVDISGQTPGIYFLLFESGDRKLKEKLVIE